jgi:hypothetical protein
MKKKARVRAAQYAAGAGGGEDGAAPDDERLFSLGDLPGALGGEQVACHLTVPGPFDRCVSGLPGSLIGLSSRQLTQPTGLTRPRRARARANRNANARHPTPRP